MLLFAVVETLDPGRQAVTGLVDEIDGFVEIPGFHDSEHRPEQLGHVREATWSDVPLHAGCHNMRILFRVRFGGSF